MITAFSPSTLGTRAARRAAFVARQPYRGFDDVAVLRNEDMEMVVVPACGRIIHYAPPGHDNYLWEASHTNRQPTTKRKSSRAKSTNGWTNYGGDKAWPWPQSRWPQVMGREWPPPEELDREPHELRVVSRCAVSMTSAPLPEFGVRVAREITLTPRGNRATVRTTLEPIDDDGASEACPWAAWSVAQIRVPAGRIAVRIDPNTDLPAGHKPLAGQAWDSIRRIGGDILLTRAPNQAAKIGADGDLIAAEFGNWLFVQKRLPDESNTGRRISGEAAQLYTTGKLADAGRDASYVEFEFTGRRAQVRPTLTVQWDLIEWNPANTDNELAALLRTM